MTEKELIKNTLKTMTEEEVPLFMVFVKYDVTITQSMLDYIEHIKELIKELHDTDN